MCEVVIVVVAGAAALLLLLLLRYSVAAVAALESVCYCQWMHAPWRALECWERDHFTAKVCVYGDQCHCGVQRSCIDAELVQALTFRYKKKQKHFQQDSSTQEKALLEPKYDENSQVSSRNSLHTQDFLPSYAWQIKRLSAPRPLGVCIFSALPCVHASTTPTSACIDACMCLYACVRACVLSYLFWTSVHPLRYL